MGMAASQARFLGLTARKTNVEYEGQQINQQRTALSNQSASYNNQLLNLNVPTAPSTDKYTKTTYSWKSAGNTQDNTITNLVPVAGTPDKYKIDYNYSKNSNEGYESTSTSSTVARTLVTPSQPAVIANPNATPAIVGSPAVPAVYTYAVGGVALTQANSDEVAALKNTSASYKNDNFYKYTDPVSLATSYYSEAALASGNEGTQSMNPITLKIGSHTQVETVPSADATIVMDGTGRMTNITIGGKTYEMTANTTTDDKAYDSAMNQYEYDKNVYNKALADVNAKTSIIQTQDKSLELKLKQCDTEQQAISTEMDSVKKVADKNIESSFKTFSA